MSGARDLHTDPAQPGGRLGRAYALLGLGEACYTATEIAAKASISLEDARHLWARRRLH